MSFQDAHSVNVAYIATVLAHNPDLERLLRLARQLNEGYRSGSVRVPAELDLSGYDDNTAELLAAFTLAITGGSL